MRAERFRTSQDGETSEPSAHGAWELFEREATEAQISAEQASLEDEITAIMLSVVERLMSDDSYSIFVDPPEPSESFPSREGGALNLEDSIAGFFQDPFLLRSTKECQLAPQR